jgi:hypothetical protein
MKIERSRFARRQARTVASVGVMSGRNSSRTCSVAGRASSPIALGWEV